MQRDSSKKKIQLSLFENLTIYLLPSISIPSSVVSSAKSEKGLEENGRKSKKPSSTRSLSPCTLVPDELSEQQTLFSVQKPRGYILVHPDHPSSAPSRTLSKFAIILPRFSTKYDDPSLLTGHWNLAFKRMKWLGEEEEKRMRQFLSLVDWEWPREAFLFVSNSIGEVVPPFPPLGKKIMKRIAPSNVSRLLSQDRNPLSTWTQHFPSILLYPPSTFSNV